MLEWAVRQTEYPVAIRVPGVAVVHRKEEVDTDYSELNRYKMTARGETVAILALGSFYAVSYTHLCRTSVPLPVLSLFPEYIPVDSCRFPS